MVQLFTFLSASWKRLVLALVLAVAAALPAAAQIAYALADYHNSQAASGRLVTFDVQAPGTFITSVPITGLAPNQSAAGLDIRPSTGELFILGYKHVSTTEGQVYKINPTTGVVTAVGPAISLDFGANGNQIGFDFDPTTDRIRVTNGQRNNYRLNPTTGALEAIDGMLTYASTDVNAAQLPMVGTSAYSNSYIGSTSTTLYDIDERSGQLVTQNPANAGTLHTVATLHDANSMGIGIVRRPVEDINLDIFFNSRTRTNTGYLTRTLSGVTITSELYTVDLTTGFAVWVGGISPSSGLYANVWDIAVTGAPVVPGPIADQLAYALAGPNLLTFDTALPGTIRTAVGITGVDASQTLVGLDVRPANNVLYALGYNPAAAAGVANSQLYSLNATTGVATPNSAAFRLELGTGAIGFDFNPTVDRIRVVGANRHNYRLDPTFGTSSPLAATDGVLAYTANAATPTIGAVAYTNSFAGSTTATLYNYDLALNLLNTQATANPPADGQLTPVGTSSLVVNAAAPAVDLDIYSTATGLNTAYLVANTGTSANTVLYTVDLATGTATVVGAIGYGIAARCIAIANPTGVATGTKAPELASDLALYPNPLAGSTQLHFTLPRAAHVELTVTDALGRVVDHLDAGQLSAGPQAIRWARKSQAAGVYSFRLSFDGQPAGTRQGVLSE